MQSNVEVKYHPGLPSLAEAKEDYNTVTSDHVPFLTTISVPNDSLEDLEIKIVSWNVLAKDDFNGFAPLGKSVYEETSEQTTARHLRIADSIAKFANNHIPDFITLQEIPCNGSDEETQLFRLIMQEINEHYAAVIVDGEVVAGYESITLYKKGRFVPIIPNDIKTANYLKHHEFVGTKVEFQLWDDDTQKIRIVSAHPSFNPHPKSHEDKINKFLHEKGEHSLSVVIGDFNCGIAPIDADPENIVTSAATSFFRDYQFQGACAIDGGFYSYKDAKNGEIICQNAVIKHLNPVTGWPYLKKELLPIDIENIPEKQQNEILDLHMVICVDESYYDQQIINEQTIFEYEDYLKEQFQQNNIIVRDARNLNNDTGIGIVMDSVLSNCLQLANNPHFQFRTENHATEGLYKVVYTQENYIGELTQVIDKLVHNKKMLTLASSIKLLEDKKEVPRDVVTGFKKLYEALCNDSSNPKTSTIETITKHFILEADKTLQTPGRTFKDIEKSAKELDYKLYGKPPMNKYLKAAVCGLIGALVGAALGVTVGIGVTVWCGGVGALPGSILGAVTGFSLGFTIGLGTGAVTGGLGGGIYGFLTSPKHHVNYLENKEAIKKELIMFPALKA